MLYAFWGVQLEYSKLVIFDVDGTLNQTERYAVDAYRKALHEIGMDHFTDEQLKSRIGAPFQEDICFFLGDQANTLGEQFLTCTARYWFEGIRKKAAVYPGTYAMLDSLKQKGYQLAVCSNAEPKELELILDALNIKSRFDYIQSLTEKGTKKESLKKLLECCNPQRAVMVGDRDYDREAAERNEIAFIACMYGYGAPGELERCEYQAASVLEIPDLVNQLDS